MLGKTRSGRHRPPLPRGQAHHAIRRRYRRGWAWPDPANKGRRATAAQARPTVCRDRSGFRKSARSSGHLPAHPRPGSATAALQNRVRWSTARSIRGRDCRRRARAPAESRARGRFRPAARRHRANSADPPRMRATTSRAAATVSMYRSTEKLWPSRRMDASRSRGVIGILGAPPSLRRRQQGEFGVGARQNDDLPRRLGEIDRRHAVGDRPGYRRQEMHSAAQHCGDGGAIEPLLPDHDKAARALLTGSPRPVEIALHPIADGLDDLAPAASRVCR